MVSIRKESKFENIIKYVMIQNKTKGLISKNTFSYLRNITIYITIPFLPLISLMRRLTWT